MFGKKSTPQSIQQQAQQQAAIAAHNFSFPSQIRYVSLSHKICCFVGGILNQVGWFFLLFGSSISWLVVPNTDISSLLDGGSNYSYTTGTVTRSEKMAISQGEGSDSKPYFAIHFATTIDGVQVEGKSFNLGRELAEGTAVEIAYKSGNPSSAHIKGMGRRPFGLGGLLVLIFPLAGAAMLVPGITLGKKLVALLGSGTITSAKLKEKRSTNTKINDQPVYKYILEFQNQNGNTYTTEFSTHRSEIFAENSESDVIYLPQDPSISCLTDVLPGGVRFDHSKQLLAQCSVIKIAILPLLTVFTNSLMLIN